MVHNTILKRVEEALAKRQTVFITDGTVTRRVLEISESDGELFISGDANTWVTLVCDLCGYVDGWNVMDAKEGLYIAPNWWIKI